jgi:hypothetical protein
MKKLILLSALLIFAFGFSQESPTYSVNELDTFPSYKFSDEEYEISFERTVFIKNIIKYISHKWRQGTGASMGMSGKFNFNIIYKLNQYGEFFDVKVKSDIAEIKKHNVIEKEFQRILKKIPNVKGAIKKNRKVVMVDSFTYRLWVNNKKRGRIDKL